jgi:nucleoside 2-deoxyribosyltransferase
MVGRKTIVICSSASFYEHVNQIAQQLEKKGYKTLVPHTAGKMRKTGDYDLKNVKTWLNNPKDFKRKRWLAKTHFEEIASGDAILLVNDDKPGQPAYIGPNGTMEWGVAYYLKKPVFIWKGVPKTSNFYEEVYGMATVIDGDLARINL